MSKTADALADLKERFKQEPPAPSEIKGVLQEPEVVRRRSSKRQEWVQKNLSIPKSDADRFARLSRRDGLSQSALLRAALDAYEKSRASRGE